MAFPLINPSHQFFNDAGAVLASGTIEFRDPISNALIDSFPTAADADAQTNANANPLTLGADGRAGSGLYLEEGVDYKVIIKDADGVTIDTQDDVRCPIYSQAAIGASLYPETSAETSAGVTPTNYYEKPGSVLRYGATGDGATDDTQAIRDALAVADSAGGMCVYLPSGTYVVSTVATPAHCLSIPANTHFKGESAGSTIITRTVANVNEASILISNKGSDTESGYTADGNIVISDLTFRDSLTTERTQQAGDLIAFGHCDTAIVRDCFFGKHGQHCVDIVGSKNIKVINCIEDNTNGLTGAAANSSVQVDRAISGAHIDVFADNTESKNIIIKGNHFSSTNTNEILHIGHNGGTAHNIIISENYLYGTARSFSSLIRCDQDDASIDGLTITDNIIECTTANNAAIALDCDGAGSESLKNITIRGNTIKGNARIGILVGGTSDFAEVTFPDFQNIVIADNIVDITTTSSTVSAYGIWAVLCENVTITGNTVHLTRDTDTIAHYGINTTSCLSSIIRGNTVKTTLSGAYVGTVTTASIALGRFASILDSTAFTMEASDNYVDVSAFKYGLLAEGMDSLEVDKPRFSGNTFIGSLANGLYHIYETLPASDGTNGILDVDFGSGALTKTVAVDTTYSITTGLKKAGTSGASASPSYFGLIYTPGANTTLATTSEALVANQADIGLQVQDYDQNAGTFDITTGSTGTQLSIVQGGADTTQTAGNIRMRFGI